MAAHSRSSVTPQHAGAATVARVPRCRHARRRRPVAMSAATAAAAPKLTLPAPAKVNYFLHITGQRDDGYHTLETLFVLIDLADSVTLALRDDGVIARDHAIVAQ